MLTESDRRYLSRSIEKSALRAYGPWVLVSVFLMAVGLFFLARLFSLGAELGYGLPEVFKESLVDFEPNIDYYGALVLAIEALQLSIAALFFSVFIFCLSIYVLRHVRGRNRKIVVIFKEVGEWSSDNLATVTTEETDIIFNKKEIGVFKNYVGRRRNFLKYYFVLFPIVAFVSLLFLSYLSLKLAIEIGGYEGLGLSDLLSGIEKDGSYSGIHLKAREKIHSAILCVFNVLPFIFILIVGGSSVERMSRIVKTLKAHGRLPEKLS